MGSLFGSRRKGKNVNVPRYATREEVINLFLKYYHVIPDEEGIRANMGNPGGPAAIEKMLRDSLPPEEQPTAVSYPTEPVPDSNPISGTMQKMYNYIAKPRTMSYWRQINQHYLDDYLTFFICVDNNIMLVDIDKSSLEIRRDRVFLINHEGEGAFFSALQPYSLFIPIGNELRKYDIRNGTYEIVMQVNGLCWQPHADYFEHNFSCSIKRGEAIVAWGLNGEEIEIKGNPDECQIDKSGQYLLCKENNGNRIIHIASRSEYFISFEEGRVGHSDCGFGTLYGENSYSNYGGALDEINMANRARRNVYHTDVWNMGYFSYSNAKPKRETFGILSSSDGRLIKVNIESGEGTILGTYPNHPTDYDRRIRANVCPEGQFCAFIDANFKPWIVRIP